WTTVARRIRLVECSVGLSRAACGIYSRTSGCRAKSTESSDRVAALISRKSSRCLLCSRHLRTRAGAVRIRSARVQVRQIFGVPMAVRPKRTWETSRLFAKPAVVEDTQVVFREYASDPHVAKYMTWTPHRSITDTTDFLNRCERVWSDGSAYPWSLWQKHDGA